MKVGKMTEARDQVLTTFFSLRLFISSTRPWRRSSMNGPFLIERDMLYLLPLLAMTRSDDEPSGRLGPPGSIPHGGLAPRRLGRHPRRGLALATAVRMVSWVHDHAADLRALAHVSGATGLAEVLVLVVEVADLADRGHAAKRNATHLARRHPDRGVVALLGEELGGDAGRPDDLAALAGDELNVVDRRAERDVGERQGVADPRLRIRTGHDDIADFQAVRHEHVSLLAVTIEEQPDPTGAVRVVLDRRDAGGNAELVALEVDPPIVLLLAAAAMANGQPALVVPAGAASLGLEQRLVRLVGRDLLERRPRHLTESRRGGLVGTQRHWSDPLEELDLLAGGQGHDRFAPGCRVTGDPATLRAAALFLGLRREHVHARDGHLLLGVELLDRGLDLDLVGVAVDRERVLAAGRLVDRLLADDGPDDDVGGRQGGHEYTSSIRARAGCSIRTRSALRRSTTLSESARRISTVGRLRADSSSFSSRPGAITRTRPRASSAPRTLTSSRVLIASIPKVSMTLIASSPNLAVRAPRSASRFILRGRRCSYERGCGPNTAPPPR